MLVQTRVRVFAFSTVTSLPVTGAASSITATWSKDYGVPVATEDVNPTEASGGFYYFDLSADERDVQIIGEIFPVSSTSGVQVIGVPAFFAKTSPVDLTANAIAEVASAAAANIVLGLGQAQNTIATSTTLQVHQGETVAKTVFLWLDAEMTVPLDLSGRDIIVLFETQFEAFVAKVENPTITGAGNNGVTFNFPATVTADRSDKIWTIRDTHDETKVHGKGPVKVLRAATKRA